MTNILPGRFTRYELNQAEFEAGIIFSPLQKMVINNFIADLVDEKINLHFDGAEPYKFASQEAEITGKISSLQYLLELSDETLRQTMIRAQREAQNQSSNS